MSKSLPCLMIMFFQGRRVLISQLTIFIKTGTLMYLMASGLLFCSLLEDEMLQAMKLLLVHCEQNLTQDGQSIVDDPQSAAGAIWSRFLYFSSRQKHGNQDVCEPFISLGEFLGLCIGSLSAKMFMLDGRVIPEFVFAKLYNTMLSQLSSAHDESDSPEVNDVEHKFLPVYHTKAVRGNAFQEPRKDIWWTMLAQPKFFEVCDRIGQMQRVDKDSIFKLINEELGFPIVEAKRVGSSKDKVSCGCYLEGHASLRVDCPTKQAMDGHSEQEFVKHVLVMEHENSVSFEVTSQSHNYLSINGGKHLIELWTNHNILAHLPTVSHRFSSTTIKSMLALNSPDTLSNEEKGYGTASWRSTLSNSEVVFLSLSRR